jgi:hypothetical protein
MSSTRSAVSLLSRQVCLRIPLLAGMIVIAGFVGAVLVYFLPYGSKAPTLERGTVVGVTADASQIAFHPDGAAGLPHDEGHGYVVSDVEWIDREGQRHSGGTPHCFKPGTQGQRVELATVRVRTESGGYSTIVAWAQCL